jgi:hypothetical protein
MYEWEIDTLKNVIENMENETTDYEFLIDSLTSVIDTIQEKEMDSEDE